MDEWASPRVTRAVMVVKGHVMVWVTMQVRASRARIVRTAIVMVLIARGARYRNVRP